MLPLDTPTSGQLASGDREVFYRVTTTNPGEFEVVVDTVGGWPAAIQLLRADAFINMSRDQVSNRLTYATSRYSDIIVVVRSQLPALSGPLDFDITVGHRDLAAPPVETEPNDASQPELVGALPAMRGGTLEDGPDNEDVFAIEVTRGQRIWALGSSEGGTSVFGFDVELELIRSDSSVATRSTFGGEGFYPAIYGFVADATDTWTVRASVPAGSGEIGGYNLWMSTKEPVAVGDVEPNDQAQPQVIGQLDDVAVLDAAVGPSDTEDAFTFTITRPIELDAFLRYGSVDGFNLQVYDDQGAQLSTSGQPFNSDLVPSISGLKLDPGTYTVVLGSDSADAPTSVILVAN